MRTLWLLIGAGLGLVIGLGAGSQAHPSTEPDRREIRIHHIRGPVVEWGEWHKPRLYHMPDFEVCYVYAFQGGAHGGPYAVNVPCPWEKK